ncbi:hypothetical protein GGU11DRAFT_674865, partial [Lentinula aff. detonsa]
TTSKGVNQQELGRSATPLLNVWIYFNLVSNIILLPILVLTFVLSKKVTKRHPSLINVCITWIFFGIFSLLLFFGGRAKPTDPNPSAALCIVQTSLLFGIPPMWSVAIFVLMYFILGHMLLVRFKKIKSQTTSLPTVQMLGAPYIVQFCFSLATLVISLQNPQYVTRQHRFFYCALEYPPLSNAMSIFTLIFCLAIITIQFRICLVLYRNCRGLRQAGESMVVDLQFLVRVVVFGVFIITGMFVDVLSMFSQRSVAPDLYVATAGTIVFLVFGSQADVLRVWCFWRKDGPIRVSPASSRESVWANFDLNRSPRKNRTILSESSVTLSPPIPVHLATHIHERNL